MPCRPNHKETDNSKWTIKGETMLSKTIKIIVGTIVAMGIFACSQQNVLYQKNETPLEKNWGRSFESARYNQILNPEAGKNLKPVEGLTGPAAEKVMHDYMTGEKTIQKQTSEFGIVNIKK